MEIIVVIIVVLIIIIKLNLMYVIGFDVKSMKFEF